MNPWADREDFGREAAKCESVGEAVMLSLLWWKRDGWTLRTQYPLIDYRIDIAVPEAKLAIEVDSLEGHGSAAAMEHDAERSNALLAIGWVVVRYSARQTLARTWRCASDVLGHIEGRITRKYRPLVQRPSKAAPRPNYDPGVYAAGGKGLLAALSEGPSAPTSPRRKS